MQNKPSTELFPSLSTNALVAVTGGVMRKTDDGPTIVSPETVGCAVGGALGSLAGPWGGAAGCVVGGMVANQGAREVAKDKAGIKPNHPYKPYGY